MPTPHKNRIDAFISSTSIDLPEYRTEVIKVLTTLKIQPNGMEHWPVTGDYPVDLCKRMVDDSEIFIGIYAYRYGWQPDGYVGKSITELEYDWAGEVQRGGKPIPRLCFIMSDDFGWPKSKWEMDKQAQLDEFKKRVKANHVGFFTTPDNLAKQITAALATVLKERYPENVTPQYKCVSVPPPPPYFAGRAEILKELETRLTAGNSVAVTAVRGVGGMGKTTLAKALAQRLANADERRFGLMLWAEIGQGANEETERATLRGWARDLAGIDLPTDADAAKLAPQVKRIIAEAAQLQCGEPILLILDDVWPESLALAKRLRAAVPDEAHLLVTTRSENVAIDLDCGDLALGKLPKDEGAAMLRNLIEQDGAGKLNDADVPKLATLSEVLGGYPLSLRLAARAVRRRKVGGIDAVIEDMRRGLREGDPFADIQLDKGDSKEESVSITLKQTLDILTETQREQFKMLGVLPMDLSFSQAHLYALWDVDDEMTLETLLLEGLLEHAPNQPGRYQQHRVLRAYARGLLRTAGDFEDVQRRHYGYVIAFAADLFQDEKIETWDNFSADYPQVAMVGDELVARFTGTDDPAKQDALFEAEKVQVPEAWRETTAKFVANVGIYISRRNIGVQGRNWLWAGLSAVQGTGLRREGLFLNGLGLWYNEWGYYNDALRYYERSLVIERALNNLKDEAVTLNNIGTLYFNMGDMSTSLNFFHQALIGRHEIEDLQGEAATLNNIGMVYRLTENLDAALNFYQQALTVARAISDLNIEAAVLNNIGSVYQAREDLAPALDFYYQALPIITAIGDRVIEAALYGNIASIYKQQGKLDEAINYEEHAVVLTKQSRHPDLTIYMSYLEEWKQERDSGSSGDEEQIFLHRITAIYRAEGEVGVRAMMRRSGATNAQIENTLTELRGSGA